MMNDRKRPRLSQEDCDSSVTAATDDDTHQLIAEHYSSRSNQTIEEREASPIIHLKKLNNWIKSVLVQTYTKRDDRVLDLGCGKGGDLIKWDKAKIGFYVGIDIAEGSIEDARLRYNGEASHMRRQQSTFSFEARLICADCFSLVLDEVLIDDAPFDICSCQFALHYSWSSEQRARVALQNATTVLKPGGYFFGTIPDSNVIVKKLRAAEGLEFGNSVYNVRFDEVYGEKVFPMFEPFGIQYQFVLEDAVDCPEWLVPFHPFVGLAAEYGLELVYKKNFHEFVHEHMQNPNFADLMRKLGALGNGTSKDTISGAEWDAAYLYMAFVFRKKGDPLPQSARKPRKPAAPISEKDLIYVQLSQDAEPEASLSV